MGKANDEPMPPSAPFPASPYASRSSERQWIDGVVLAWPNWRVLTGKVAKVNARFSAASAVVTAALMVLFLVPTTGFGAEVLTGLLVGLLIGPAFAFFFSWLGAYLVMCLLFWPVKLTLRVMQWSPPDQQVALTSGGLVALVWALPSAFSPLATGVFEVVFSLFGLSVNILAGQIGAVLALVDRFRDPPEQEESESRPMRFSLWALLAVMVPICVTLTLFRWLGLLRVETLVILLAWLVLQHVLRKPAVWLTLWWLDRKARKQIAIPRPDEI